MKRILRSVSAAVIALALAASAGKLTAKAAGGCVHTDAIAWDESQDMSGTGVYRLDNSVTLSNEIQITGDITLCLNGNTITAADGFRVFDIRGGSLTLCDCKGTGAITGGSVIEYSGNGGSSGGAVYVDNGGAFTLQGGEITNSSAAQGGGVYVHGGAFIMNGGIISKNNSAEGGGVYVSSDSTFTMTGGTIFNNEVGHQGGGIYVSGGGTFEMKGGTISGNSVTEAKDTTYGGGGVYTAGTSTMSGSSKITGNTAGTETVYCFGGGVCVSGNNAKFTLERGTLSGNKALYGGGVHMSSQGLFEMNGGTIGGGNVAVNGGGGVSLGGDDCKFIMGGGAISSNKAKYGGGAYLDKGVFTMSDGTISENTAINNGDGGGAYLSGGTFNISGGTLSNNSAESNGGGVFLNMGDLTMSGGAISGNKAEKFGSCVYMERTDTNQGGTMLLNGKVTITSNTNSNVYLKTGKKIAIGSGFDITNKIGIHTENDTADCQASVPATEFDTGVQETNISDKFKADREKQIVVYNEAKKQVELKGPHKYGEDWKIDAVSHSNKCTLCGYELITEPHNFDGGVVTRKPTYTREGEITYTCLTCKYTKTAPVAIKTSSSSGSGTAADNDAAPNPPTGIVISLAPTAVAAVAVLSALTRKKK